MHLVDHTEHTNTLKQCILRIIPNIQTHYCNEYCGSYPTHKHTTVMHLEDHTEHTNTLL